MVPELAIAGIMNLTYFLLKGIFDAPAGSYVPAGRFSRSFSVRQGVLQLPLSAGTVSRYPEELAEKLFAGNFRLLRGLAMVLRGSKYLLLGFFVWAVSTMSASGLDSVSRCGSQVSQTYPGSCHQV